MPVDSDAEMRDDIRVSRTIPVVILPLSDQPEDDQITVGLTQDISCDGMSLVTLGPLPENAEIAIGIRDIETFAVLLCQCVRRQAIGFGFYQTGIVTKEVLPSKDFIPLQELAKHLEDNPPRSILSMVDTNSFHHIQKLGES